MTSSLASGFAVARLADATGARRALQRGFSLLAAVVFLGWWHVASWPAALALAIAHGAAVGSHVPLLDAAAIDGLGIERQRYGWIRLWGTAGYLVATKL